MNKSVDEYLMAAIAQASEKGIIQRNNPHEIAAHFFVTGFWAGELATKLKYSNKSKNDFITDEINHLNKSNTN